MKQVNHLIYFKMSVCYTIPNHPLTIPISMKKQSFEVRRKINRETFLLYTLFFLSTAILLGVVHLILAKINLVGSIETLSFRTNNQLEYDSPINIGISATLLAFILGCFLYKYINTRQGYLIARQLGGTEITHNHSNPYYTIFNQSIIEMAITANIPPPRTFVLLNDTSINAFAAGTSAQDAVIAITRGALEFLTPSELKALVAHEVSHIASGDTRMNRKVTAVIFGFMALTSLAYILFRLGLEVTHSSRSSSKKNNTIFFIIAFFIAATCVYLLSKVLEVFGKIIQSWLSRKREYYADSQAIVSMRQTLPIYHLLLKLKSASIPEKKNVHAQKFGENLSKKFGKGAAPEYQHFYFDHHSAFSLFATHPPLTKRIQAISDLMSPQDRALLQAKSTEQTLLEKFGKSLDEFKTSATSFMSDNASSEEMIGFAMPLGQLSIQGPTLQTQAEIQARVPKAFIKDLNDPNRFPLIIYACLLSQDNMLRNHQLKLLGNVSEAELNTILKYINNNEIEYKSVLYRLLYTKFNALPTVEKEAIFSKVEALTEKGRTTITTFGIVYTLRRLTRGNTMDALPPSFDKMMTSFTFLAAFILQKASQQPLVQAEKSFQKIMKEVDPVVDYTMPAVSNEWEKEFEDAINKLAQHPAEERERIIMQLKNVVIQDAIITQEEYELLQLLGFCLNVPVSVSLEIGP